ncbi:MAG TPA: carboxypeptidase-like regulatory domain-containing protein, partial [Pedobacter sp.]|uniref:carboxypeptidase-like regulatory domain-containing protein n=1 Tax=Pedobacter sp. TaxID=1411316 RepID=UPI002BFA39B1
MKILYAMWHPVNRLVLWVPILFLLFAVSADAQTKQYILSGRVTEGSSQVGIPGVVVKVQNTNFAVATSSEGKFNLPANLSSGTYQIVFSSIGFKTQTKTVQLGTGVQVVVNGELTADNIGLDEVIITGTSQGTTRKQMGSYVSSVKGD